jgi:hypothetical protein
LKRSWVRPVVEVFTILLLLYTNLLMGQFVRAGTAGRAQPIWSIMTGIVTPQNLLIGLVGATVAFLLVELVNRN